ncbi:MAG: phosphate ABC transporter substrate-binding protein PstS [Actinomycetota bacterium]
MPKSGNLIRITVIAALAALVAVVAAGAASAQRQDTVISGAGSTFVQPLVAQWTTPLGGALGYSLQYSGVGSGAGVSAITARTVDFGASDAPLTPDQFTACKGCLQIPWALSATAIIYNANGVPNLLHMDGPTLAQIFMGKITTWNDPAIAKLNPKASLPGTKIAIVHRSDNSGTTYNLTDYLSSASPEWKSSLGKGVAVNWPVGTGQKGSSGVAAGVTQTDGGIGYTDVYYAIHNHLKYFAMKNASGKFATPGLKGILAAASSDQTPDPSTNELSIVNPPKKHPLAYPISTYTYVIVPQQTSKAADIKKFLFWAVTKGQTFGPKLLFQPIPKSVLVVAEKTIAKIHS